MSWKGHSALLQAGMLFTASLTGGTHFLGGIERLQQVAGSWDPCWPSLEHPAIQQHVHCCLWCLCLCLLCSPISHCRLHVPAQDMHITKPDLLVAAAGP